PGLAPGQSGEIKVSAGEKVEGVIIDLEAGGAVRGGVVLRGSGKPVSGAQVSFKSTSSRSDPWGTASASTEVDGSFVLGNIPAGVVDLFVYHADYAQGSLPGVQIREGETAQVTLELGAGGGVRGTVTRGGKPLAGARVALRKSDQSLQGPKDAVTESEGRFEVKGLPAGDYVLSLLLPAGKGSRGMRMAEKQNVTVFEGQVSEVEVVEAEVASIHLTGRVSSGGEALRGGSIQVIQP